MTHPSFAHFIKSTIKLINQSTKQLKNYKQSNYSSQNRFWYLLQKDFTEHSKCYTFCPGPNCGRAVHYSGLGELGEICCACGTCFCFKCGAAAHIPVTCKELTDFEERASRDDESIKCIHATAKECPNCKSPTERNQGCNHMTCSKCGHQWCWMCCGDWKDHGSETGGFYKCNLYDSSEQKEKDIQAKKEAAESKNFLEYYNKYFNNKRSYKELEELKESLSTKWDKTLNEEIGMNSEKKDIYHSTIDEAITRCIEVYFTFYYESLFFMTE